MSRKLPGGVAFRGADLAAAGLRLPVDLRLPAELRLPVELRLFAAGLGRELFAFESGPSGFWRRTGV
ncbi:hypothetical protein [Gordonia sp. (in: high G+C Gram-positive bacteria)]|uniref:hypothetical protein n=1 Tax=Gordonia sp. (in: high G+C Gram-positive bacteria) TaxID=84139 RepID=UPI003C750FD9